MYLLTEIIVNYYENSTVRLFVDIYLFGLSHGDMLLNVLLRCSISLLSLSTIKSPFLASNFHFCWTREI